MRKLTSCNAALCILPAAQGLRALVNHRPDDPYEFLADFLLRSAPLAQAHSAAPPAVVAAGGSADLAVPTDGIAVWALREFVNARSSELAGKSTGSVCFEIIKPETRPGKCAYVDTLRGSRRAADGLPAVGQATVFLSHAVRATATLLLPRELRRRT